MNKFIFIFLSFFIAHNVFAQCSDLPDCTTLGYTKAEADCLGEKIRCPFDLSKVFCSTEPGDECSNCKIGDILFSDNTCSASPVGGKTAIGIVSDNLNAVAVALNEEGRKNFSLSYNGLPKNSMIDGKSNSTDAYATANFATELPAFQACYARTNGGLAKGSWMLPAKSELMTMYINKDLINAGLAKVSGSTQFGDKTYWSSSSIGNTSSIYVSSADYSNTQMPNGEQSVRCAFKYCKKTSTCTPPCSGVKSCPANSSCSSCPLICEESSSNTYVVTGCYSGYCGANCQTKDTCSGSSSCPTNANCSSCTSLCNGASLYTVTSCKPGWSGSDCDTSTPSCATSACSVGSIKYSDNTCSFGCLRSGVSAIGIVYGSSGSKHKIIALSNESSGMLWHTGTPNKSSGATNTTNGQANSQSIALTSDNYSHVAVMACRNKSGGYWYLPAQNELQSAVKSNGYAISDGLITAGQPSWGGFYWSSTESSISNAFYFYVTSTYYETGNTVKNYSYPVRCVGVF